MKYSPFAPLDDSGYYFADTDTDKLNRITLPIIKIPYVNKDKVDKIETRIIDRKASFGISPIEYRESKKRTDSSESQRINISKEQSTKFENCTY